MPRPPTPLPTTRSPQRLAGFYVLVDLYRSNASGMNPFFSVFIGCLEQGTSACEQHFISTLLSGGLSAGLSEKSPTELLKEYSSRGPVVSMPELTALRK